MKESARVTHAVNRTQSSCRMLLFIVAFLCCLNLVCCDGFPIPPHGEYGHFSGNPAASVRLTQYLDYLCPFCKRAHPIVNQVVEHYGDKIYYQQMPFPLLMHHNGFFAAFVGEIVANASGSAAYFKYVDHTYEVQEEFYDENTWNISQLEVASKLCDIAKLYGVKHADCMNLMTTDAGNALQSLTQHTGIYGAQQQVWSTPSFFINGVFNPDISSSWTFEQWTTYLDQLLKA